MGCNCGKSFSGGRNTGSGRIVNTATTNRPTTNTRVINSPGAASRTTRKTV